MHISNTLKVAVLVVGMFCLSACTNARTSNAGTSNTGTSNGGTSKVIVTVISGSVLATALGQTGTIVSQGQTITLTAPINPNGTVVPGATVSATITSGTSAAVNANVMPHTLLPPPSSVISPGNAATNAAAHTFNTIRDIQTQPQPPIPVIPITPSCPPAC